MIVNGQYQLFARAGAGCTRRKLTANPFAEGWHLLLDAKSALYLSIYEGCISVCCLRQPCPGSASTLDPDTYGWTGVDK